MKDKSELIDELLVKVAHGKINSKEAKAILQKAFREVEIEGRKDELHKLGESFLTTRGLMWVIARNQELKDELTNIKEAER